MLVGSQPGFAFDVEIVVWAVVNDQEELVSRIFDQTLEEDEESVAVEGVCKGKVKAGVLQGECSVDVRGFAFAPGADSRLAADARPGLMQGRVELETGFIFEEDRCPLALGFFLEPGTSCAAISPVPADLRD